MLIFISGSINAGKTTTSRLLAESLGYTFINVDDLTDKVDRFDIYMHLDLAMDLAIEAINTATAEGKDIVANFVIRKEDYARFQDEITADPKIFITLCPGMDVALSKRGDRDLTKWEIKRIKAHYEDGIASPDYGHIIDNSNLTVEEAVAEIRLLVDNLSY